MTSLTSKRWQGPRRSTLLKLAALPAVGAALLAAAAPGAAQQPTAGTQCPAGFDYSAEKKPTTALYGVHDNLSVFPVKDQAAHLQPTREVRAQVARVTMLWSSVEPVRGQRDWSRMDAAVANLVAAGIEPLIVFYHSPTWANGASPGPNAGDQVPTDPARFDQWVNDYANFITAAAQRYQGRVRLWEVWNEENGRFTWQPRPNPAQYGRFYTRIRAALKSVDSGNRVAMGGIGNITAGHPDSIYGLDYLKQLNATGVFPDIVAVHAFPSQAQAPDVHVRFQNNFDDIQAVRDYMQSVNWNAPMWVTEWGWSTDDNRSGIDAVDQDTQAQYVYCSLNILARDYRYVTLATYFLDRDRDTFSYGLYNRDGTSKPSGRAFQKFMRENNVQPVPGAVSPLDIEDGGGGLGGGGGSGGGGGPGGGSGSGNTTDQLRRAGVHNLKISPLTFRVPHRRVHVARGLGTRVHYRLRKNALVHFRVETAKTGRMRNGKCEPGRPRGGERSCTAWVDVAGHFFKTGKRGDNSFRFAGRMRRRALPPGLHLLIASRADGGPGIGTPFWVERRR